MSNAAANLPNKDPILSSNGSNQTEKRVYILEIDDTPNNAVPYFKLALLLKKSETIKFFWGSLITKQGLLLKTIDLDPSIAKAYLELARTLSPNGKIQLLDGSTKTKQKLILNAIDLDPDNEEAYDELSKLKKELDRPNASLKP